MLFNNNEQKSPARRFLLILGVVGFVCVITLAMMVMFWEAMLPNLSKTQRIVFGLVLVGYGVLRFSRLLKKRPDEV
jgi:threonine/homoserine/homoserine lactone efflux protein